MAKSNPERPRTTDKEPARQEPEIEDGTELSDELLSKVAGGKAGKALKDAVGKK